MSKLNHARNSSVASCDPSQERCVVPVASSTSGPAVLQRVAGAPAAYRRSRRGSFLVLVIGVLALISAFMVIYVAVGRADQQLSSAVQRKSVGLADSPDGNAGESSRDAVPEKFAKYVGQIIADDTVATFYYNQDVPAVRPDTGQPLTEIRLVREASDYPFTDWSRTSDALISSPGLYFDPIGTYRPELATLGTPPEVWKPSDPWLASSEPVWLNHEALNDPSSADEEYLLRKDWAQISNVAPDGVFLNLWNMRGTTANYVGNFNATHADMHKNVGLWDDKGAKTNTTDFGAAAKPLIPAYWTMRQRGAAMPVGAADGQPSSPNYRPYQWADADGDGIYDSRWIEMLDPRLDTGLDNENPRDVLGISGSLYRWVFATRIVDLSARVNVNTAGDSTSPPDAAGSYPVGLTPSDIDLRRLLGLEDAWLENQFAYEALAQSNVVNDDFKPQNYLGYTNSPSPLTSLIGNRAYLSIGHTIDRGTIASLADVNNPTDKARFGKDGDTTNGAKKRAEYYAANGQSVDGVVGSSGTNSSGLPVYQSTLRSPFGTTDLIELLSFNGVNDPSFTSTLESAAGGHYEGTSAATYEEFLRYSPLRDNRPLDVERLDVPDGNYTVARERQIYAALAIDVRKRLTTLSGARPIRNDEVPVVLDPQTNQFKVSADELSASELKLKSSVSANSSIHAYAKALVPMASDLRTWPANTADFPKYRTMNYGYRTPEVGLRMAAQLAVNLDALRSASAEPPMLTVSLWDDMENLLDGDEQANGDPKAWASRQYKWSSWIFDSNQGDIGSANMSKIAADSAGDKLCADAVNVYGVTPQPFITAAASYSIFTDSKGTDDTADHTTFQTGFPSGAPEVEIKGDRTAGAGGNSDYIGDIFAVQIVNPFSQSINLASDILFTPNDTTAANAAVWAKTRTRFDYYIEFAGRYYRLADWSNNGTPAITTDDGPIKMTLGPAESRVFFFTSLPVHELENRLRASQDTANGAVDIPPASDGDPARYIKEWLKVQMSGQSPSGLPVYVEQFDPKNGDPIPLTSGTVVDLTAVDPATPTGTAKTVRLWRAKRDTYVESLGTGNEKWDSTGENPADPSTYKDVPPQNLENDVMVDRLRDPEDGSTWNHPVKTGYNEVIGSHGWDWSSDPKELRNSRNNNRASGLTFTFAGLVSRRGDEKGKEIEKTGLLPAYCIESAFKSTNLANTSVRTYEIEAGYVKFDMELTQHDLTGGGKILYKEKDSAIGDADSWFGKQISGGPTVAANALFNSLGNAPSQWNVLDPSASGEQLQEGVAGIPKEPQHSRSLDSMRPLLWAKKLSGSPRATDPLLPLAIGSQFSFKAADLAPTTADELDQRWLTLSESWALALNFEYNNTILQSDSRWKLYYQFADSTPAANPPVFPVTDLGRLVIEPTYEDPTQPSAATQLLNAFVPFVDQNADGLFDRTAVGVREDLSLGLTPAMSVLEQFTSVPGLPSLKKAQLGTVNASTAPLAVLRVLPMLSPTPETTPGFQWWWTNQSSNNTRLDPSVDLAATIASYRDKAWVRRRPNPASASTPGNPVEFDDRDAAGKPLTDYSMDEDLNGRSGRSDITGLREQQGLLVAGEILGATRRFALPLDASVTVLPKDNSNIDFTGWDVDKMVTGGQSRVNSLEKGLSTLDYSDLNSVKNDYEIAEDKLLVPGAVLGTVTTRSDYFAVWFVVAGFKSTDVRGLGLTTPMVPSIQRRFVMVVDRSAVVKKGDKPRIVFFREVPM